MCMTPPRPLRRCHLEAGKQDQHRRPGPWPVLLAKGWHKGRLVETVLQWGKLSSGINVSCGVELGTFILTV